MSMMLSELLPEYQIPQDVWLSGICEDSRDSTEGTLFCARLGNSVDGKAYIQEAVSRGAAALLYESVASDVQVGLQVKSNKIPAIGIDSLGQKLGILASRFYGFPTAEIELVAVTGTNGKTSFTQMLAQALGALDVNCGTIGTPGYGIPGKLNSAGLTTPPPIKLQAMFRELVDKGCSAVVVEASSQGLAQHRLNGSDIDVAVFTNITHEHLDYHHTVANYQAAKHCLFEFGSLHCAVVNVDDAWGRSLASELVEKPGVCSFSLSDETADVYSPSQLYKPTGIELVIAAGDDRASLQLPLFGSFNVQNLLAVVATLRIMGHPLHDIGPALQAVTPVSGRMDIITLPHSTPAWPKIVVDYAHTPDALEKCLMAIAEHFPAQNICCVFGCGGDRDRTKRPMMGTIASKHADRLVLTDDNPRQEPAEQIINDIMAGVLTQEVEVISDRREAISHAITRANPDDIVLVAGRGQENYQELAEGRIYFSDHEVIQQLLTGPRRLDERGWEG